jgi:hypothetical protein
MAKTRILSLGYVTQASPENYDLKDKYDMISAKNSKVKPDPELLNTGIDIGLMTLHIDNAPERRKLLGIAKDKDYEIMVSFSPVHLHTVQEVQGGVVIKDVLKARYAKFFNIKKEDSAGGFTYKKMFVKLMPKGSLSLDVELTEIDNDKVDPSIIELLLEDTSIGTVLDLSPVNPKDYIMLATNVIGKIQDVFGSDKAGDDPLWNDTLVLEPKPTIPGAYRLCQGFYAIVEGTRQTDFGKIVYHNNRLIDKKDGSEIKNNYLVFSIGKNV